MTLYPYEEWKVIFISKTNEELTEDDLKIKYQDIADKFGIKLPLDYYGIDYENTK